MKPYRNYLFIFIFFGQNRNYLSIGIFFLVIKLSSNLEPSHFTRQKALEASWKKRASPEEFFFSHEIICPIIEAEEKKNHSFLIFIFIWFIIGLVHAHDEQMYFSTNTGWTSLNFFVI